MAHDTPDDEDRSGDDRPPDRDDERTNDEDRRAGDDDRPSDDDRRGSDPDDPRRGPERDEHRERADDRRRDADPRDVRGPFGLGIGGHIGKLLDFLDEASDRSDQPRRRPGGRGRGGPGRTPGRNRDSSDRFSVDMDVSIGSLGGDERGGGSRDRRRRERVASDAGEYLTTVRHEGEAVVLTADLPGVEESDLTVGVTNDGGALVVGADGEELARVPVDDWDKSAVSATYNNYVLEVRVDDAIVAGDPEEVVGR